MIIAVLIPAGLFLIAIAIIAVFYGRAIEWANIGRGVEFPELFRSVYWLVNVIFYGFGEEVGWRGFALSRLQSHASALRASLLLSLGWAGSTGAVALFHASLDIFINSPVAAPLPNVMGALLTVGTILLIPVFGRQNLSGRTRVIEPASVSKGQEDQRNVP
jgi:hypothetical protein